MYTIYFLTRVCCLNDRVRTGLGIEPNTMIRLSTCTLIDLCFLFIKTSSLRYKFETLLICKRKLSSTQQTFFHYSARRLRVLCHLPITFFKPVPSTRYFTAPSFDAYNRSGQPTVNPNDKHDFNLEPRTSNTEPESRFTMVKGNGPTTRPASHVCATASELGTPTRSSPQTCRVSGPSEEGLPGPQLQSQRGNPTD